MINGNVSTFQDFSNINTDIQNLLSMIKDILRCNKHSDLQFQETEQKTYGSFTDSISELWQKLSELLKKSWEKMKDFIVKVDNVVKKWLYSDNVLDRVINIISREIYISSAKFDTQIESINLSEAYENDSLQEIEIKVKVPEDMDINKLTQFWDYLGEKIDKIIDIEKFNDPIKAKEINNRLLVVVSELD